jgi:dihydropteroate synthase
MFWQTTRFQLDLSQLRVMGIVNVTPDSFSDGGQHFAVDAARAHCEQLLQEGADLLDIGGESTRPGAQPVSAEDEWARVQPVLQHALTLGVPVSVDTYKPQVMQWALDAGADIINDVWAMRWRGESVGASPSAANAAQVIAQHGSCGVCLMHMHREPQTMQTAPMEGDAVPQVAQFLRDAALGLEAAGVARARICLDYGIGFGKTVAQNFALLARQRELLALGYPLLAGWSRKSSLASVAALGEGSRLTASVAAAVLAAERGARVLRVHDVAATKQGLAVWAAMQAQDMQTAME